MRKLILLLLILMISFGAYAQGDDGDNNGNDEAAFAGIEPDEIDFDLNYAPPPIPMMPTIINGNVPNGNAPTDRAPQSGSCDYAVDSFLAAGIEADKALIIDYEDVAYDNADKATVMEALDFIFNNSEISLLSSRIYGNIDEYDSAVADIPTNGFVNVLGQMTCFHSNGFTMRFWQVEFGGVQGWAMESITISQFDLNNLPGQNNQPADLNQIQLPVLVNNISYRLLVPHPTTPFETPDSFEAGAITACEYGAPSFLAPGVEVEFYGYGYEKFPENYADFWMNWTYGDEQLALSDFGQGRFIHNLNNHSLSDAPDGNALISNEELFTGLIYQVGTIIDGPVCTLTDITPDSSGIQEYDENDQSTQVTTWWQVETQIGGETYLGWYPESVAENLYWLWETQGIFPRKLFLYYLTPLMTLRSNNSCHRVADSLFYAGLEVEPARSTLNIRNTPGGDVVGRLEAGQATQLYGESVCEDGVRWWQSDGGWLAEREPETNAPLLQVAIRVEPTATEAPRQPEQPTAVPSTPAPRPTCDTATGSNC